eukprot:4950-Heterococcus_DN1.PRE.1
MECSPATHACARMRSVCSANVLLLTHSAPLQASVLHNPSVLREAHSPFVSARALPRGALVAPSLTLAHVSRSLPCATAAVAAVSRGDQALAAGLSPS